MSPIYRQPVNGGVRNLIATVGKDGMLRVIDRDTRERVFETPVTTREDVDAPVTTEGTRACPGVLGGVEWNGPAWHPPTGTLVTPAVDWCFTFREYAPAEVQYVEGQNYLGGEVIPDDRRTGWLTSVDAVHGDGPMALPLRGRHGRRRDHHPSGFWWGDTPGSPAIVVFSLP